MAEQNVNKKYPRNNTSLLLQPAASGFTLNQMAGNALLMPVSQQEVSPFMPEAKVEEIENFVGQEATQGTAMSTNINEPSSISLFQPNDQPSAFASFKSDSEPFIPTFNPNNYSEPSFLTTSPQANYPCSASVQDVNAFCSENTSPHHFTPISNQATALPFQGTANDPPPTTSGPPPKGPSQNFRRTAGRCYAPPPGFNSSVASPQPILSNPTNSIAAPLSFENQQQASHNQFVSNSSLNVEFIQGNLPPENSATYQQPNITDDFHQPSNIPQSIYPPSLEAPGVVMSNLYHPVTQHWFYCVTVESNKIWLPFSLLDSLSLEEGFISGSKIVATDGGRYDVSLSTLKRFSAYWEEEEQATVRRCSWFYKGDGDRFIPYEETHCQILEEAYKEAVTHNSWNKQVTVGEFIVTMHNANVIVHNHCQRQLDKWGSVNDIQLHPRVVRRGVDEFDNIDDGEPTQIDHLVFVVHGVGAVCDLKFRDLIECVNDFRSISLSLLQSHFSNAQNDGKVGRIEFLPIKWHKNLHGDATGIDRNMKSITLNSIPKLRHFSNDTILDALYYTSPVYCQTILDTVCSEINRIYSIFISRNPHFSGGKSMIGHSLGSLILFDLLLNQANPSESKHNYPNNVEITERSRSVTPMSDISTTLNSISDLFNKLNIQDYTNPFLQEEIDLDSLKLCSENDLKAMNIPLGPRIKIMNYINSSNNVAKSRQNSDISHANQSTSQNSSTQAVNYTTMGQGTGYLSVSYPKFEFSPSCFFALGSPVPMFLTVRGIQSQFNEEFQFSTCPVFFNIFHPYDPVAYRMEPIINHSVDLDPVVIPHHKGRKRLHLELKENLTKYGNDIKQKVIDSIKSTWNSVYEFARFHQSQELNDEINKAVNDEIMKQQNESECETHAEDLESNYDDVMMGKLNGGRRIDFVLQEKPIESINQYLFALASHTCYWESEDTVLFILKEIYALSGIQPNSNVKQEPKIQLYNPAAVTSVQSFERPSNYMPSPYGNSISESSSSSSSYFSQMAQPVNVDEQVESSVLPTGPPPLSGFFRPGVKK